MTTGFFEQVYRLVRQVPPGKVTSYGAIARMLGHPRAARTVGWALHSLPPSIPLTGGDEREGSPTLGGEEEREVPWHRVINSQGRISTSCQEHGAGPQRALLEAEGVEFDKHGTVDWDRFGWEGLPWPEIDDLMRNAEMNSNTR
jgi:methylated-DNA-protein-cysteine methyltransferase-like protein